jgi:hypothetical protein
MSIENGEWRMETMEMEMENREPRPETGVNYLHY